MSGLYYAYSDDQHHCPSDNSIWSVLSTAVISSKLSFVYILYKVLFFSGTWIATLRLSVKVC